MKTLFIAGNWKSNKTQREAEEWLGAYSLPETTATIVLFVPFTLLGYMKASHSSFALGAQDVSPFTDGAFTGEISARQVKEFAEWVLIGHSERRKLFGETDAILGEKVAMAKQEGLRVLYCVGDEHADVPRGVDAVAYEPDSAIGSGKPIAPEDAERVIRAIKAKSQLSRVLYGGSVTPENVRSFISQPSIDGVLPGGASLDPVKFAALIQNAT